jgi:ketosteroid isomerase-like protein
MESHSRDPVEIVKVVIAALNRGDIDLALSLCADEIVLWAPGPDLNGQHVNGKSELRELLEFTETRWPDMWTSIDSIMAVGERVAVEMTTVASEQGVSLIHPMAAFYTVKDGLIVEQRSYFDLRALEDRLAD